MSCTTTQLVMQICAQNAAFLRALGGSEELCAFRSTCRTTRGALPKRLLNREKACARSVPGSSADDDDRNLLRATHALLGFPLDVEVCYRAAKHGRLECLRYTYEQGVLCHATCVCSVAACYGQLECLRYTHQHGCPLNVWVCVMAARNGNLDCLRYAHENGCPWVDEEENKNQFLFLPPDVCTVAAAHGQLECLRYAHEHGCPWNAELCIFLTTRYNHPECVRYVRSQQN